MAEHTPTPWKIGYSDGSGAGKDTWSNDGYTITSGDIAVVMSGDSFGLLYGLRKEEDAAFIVKAVNSHEALLRALENARRDLLSLKSRSDTGSARDRRIEAAAERARAALAQVQP